MNDYINKPRVSMTPKKLSLIRTAVVAALAGFSLPVNRTGMAAGTSIMLR